MGLSLSGILPFVLLVGIHHFLLAPMLRSRKVWYGVLTAALLALFGLWCFYGHHRPMPPGQEQRELPPPGPDRQPGKGPMRPEWMELAIGILLIGGDLGLISYRRMRQDEKRLKELETVSLQQQLEALRYQINPHFFMNTLNNIQSLILTDPDKATEAVGEFSKLMRIVLYEGDEPTIPLSRELEYMRHYLSLMRLRYPEEIVIEAEFPEETGGALVPPLLMASFVENAFKHGISYTEESFVKVAVYIDAGRVTFHCLNSRHEGRQDGQHGLGLDNIRKRLSLLYDTDYRLEIEEEAGIYNVFLDIPA
jgi:LytS/YehU family sensor histidine kinase